MTTTTGLAAVARIRDPRTRATRAAELLVKVEAEWERAQAEVLAVRDGACREILADGATFADVGRVIGRTRSGVAKRFPEYAKDRP